MKRLGAWILMVTATLVVASTLGVAAAEAPTSPTPPARVVGVTGVGRAPIAQGAEQAAADAAYHQALTAAVEDGKGKAQLLTGDAGAGVGALQSVVEGNGSVECTSPIVEDEYPRYEGAEPDIGRGEVAGISNAIAPERASSTGASRSSPPKQKPKKKKKKKKAKTANAASCSVSAYVSLVYSLA